MLQQQDREPEYWLPCKKCEGCLADKRKEWAVRICHEAQCWERNSFLTLTYDEQHVPDSIQKNHVRNFIKRLERKTDRPVRYYACGEYGTQTRRPHYHAIIFNEDFLSSRYQYVITDELYGNQELENVWGNGQIAIASFDNAAAFYTAGYVSKKITDTDSFALQSRNPPIGKTWLREHYDNLYRIGTVQLEGQSIPIPEPYIRWMEQEKMLTSDQVEDLKERRLEHVKTLNDKKLKAKRTNHLAKLNLRTEKL